jgi:hypothetical protein
MAVADAPWRDEPPIRAGDADDPCRSVEVEGDRMLFLRIKHPASSFAFERWAPVLARFLATTG